MARHRFAGIAPVRQRAGPPGSCRRDHLPLFCSHMCTHIQRCCGDAVRAPVHPCDPPSSALLRSRAYVARGSRGLFGWVCAFSQLARMCFACTSGLHQAHVAFVAWAGSCTSSGPRARATAARARARVFRRSRCFRYVCVRLSLGQRLRDTHNQRGGPNRRQERSFGRICNSDVRAHGVACWL